MNSPFMEPSRHFRFSEDGITDEIVEDWRTNSHFILIPRPRKKSSAQTELFETGWTADRSQENRFINDVWRKVGMWRRGGYAGVTCVTARLVEYWNNPERERCLFFCQIEAMETLISITGVTHNYNDT